MNRRAFLGSLFAIPAAMKLVQWDRESGVVTFMGHKWQWSTKAPDAKGYIYEWKQLHAPITITGESIAEDAQKSLAHKIDLQIAATKRVIETL